ncbi:MAG TPA: DUF4328 domain-containing protein [Candidatus Thermoplasmatota archaeon]|nr:DUF4328 domain-containing protein [Candidatus Thermoplasmatota archaeon]
MPAKPAKTAKAAQRAKPAKTAAAKPRKAPAQPRVPKAKAKLTAPGPKADAEAIAWGPAADAAPAAPPADAGANLQPPPSIQVVSWGIAPPVGWQATGVAVPMAMRPTRGLVGALVGLLAASVGISAVTLAAEFLVEEWGQPGSGAALVVLQGAVSTVALGVSVALVLVFCMWLHRTLANAKARHPVAGINPGWGIGSFFVPFVHLVVPYFEVARAWRADVSSDSRPVAAWFLPWALYMLAGYVTAVLVVTIAFRTFVAVFDATSPPDTSALYEGMRPLQLVAGTVSLVLQALAAYFLSKMARQWTAHQEGPPVS